ncbi:hypothetical protein [Desulfobacula sp.]|uniref:hypothetical protein n=1 Tax=Desulfobacula sp. TaxID=2593537 RepID=UPI00261666AA|nr:hypothetical protein [Desulfobacula sp.]
MGKFNFITLIFFPGRVLCSYLRTIAAIAVITFDATAPDMRHSINRIICKGELTFGERKSQGLIHMMVQPFHLFHMEQYPLKLAILYMKVVR